MPEQLATEDGAAIDLDAAEQEFAKAMNAPEPGEPEHPAPPPRPEPTEDELGAKYGYTTGRDGRRRAKRAAGRPRTTAPPPEAKGKAKAKDGDRPDFTGPLADFMAAVWMVGAAAPVPAGPLRVKVRAQAKVLRDNTAGLVQGLNLMAQNNATIRRGVELLTMGSAGWVLPATMAIAPFAVQSAQVWRTDPAQLAEMAGETEREWEAEFAAMHTALAELEEEKQLGEELDARFGPA